MPKDLPLRLCLLLLAFLAYATQVRADYNILIIGPSKSYSDKGEKGVAKEPQLTPPVQVATELKKIMSGDPKLKTKVKGKAQVVAEDTFRFKSMQTGVGSKGEPWQMTYHAYSLAQYYYWPEGYEKRLKNLAGQEKNKWDAVVLIGDPYLINNMPGVYAEGVNRIFSQVSKSEAKTVLVIPIASNTTRQDHFAEVVTRTGQSHNALIAPAGTIWKQLNTRHAKYGPYLAAASIYGVLFEQSPLRSRHRVSTSVGQAVWRVIDKGPETYENHFSALSPFTRKNVNKRHLHIHQTGTSSERGILNGFKRALAKTRMTYDENNKKVKRYDFNLGRANSAFEKNKQYKVDPSKFDRSYGFPMGERRGGNPGGSITARYGIDKRYRNGNHYEDGTDLGIGYDMIRQGEVPKDVRSIPIRLMYAKMHEIDNKLSMHRDNWHMSQYTDTACGAYLLTATTGRCPVYDEPELDASNKKSLDSWRHWLGMRTGYETAWRLTHLTKRVPGFAVRPSSTKSVAISIDQTEKMSVRFFYPPSAPVKVTVKVDKAQCASLSTQTLVFDQKNYNQIQEITVKGSKPGAIKVKFETSSDDAVFNGLKDSWGYTVKK